MLFSLFSWFGSYQYFGGFKIKLSDTLPFFLYVLYNAVHESGYLALL